MRINSSHNTCKRHITFCNNHVWWLLILIGWWKRNNKMDNIMKSTMALFVFCCFFFYLSAFFFQIIDSTFVCSRHFKPDDIVKSLTGMIFFEFSNQTILLMNSHAIIINDSFEIIACRIAILWHVMIINILWHVMIIKCN